MESQLEECYCCDYDYELIQDIQGRMILHWNYRNLREIPDEVLNYGEHIEEIYLKRNCLEKLPSSIGKLHNLTNLYLVGNQLEELPPEIGDLKCLKVLDVSQNYIRKLPSRIGELANLQSLLLTYNQLEGLPKCLKQLHHLKQLEVSGNRIYSIPYSVIEGLKSLEEFGIDRNPINSIPRNICLLHNLRYFSACRCNLLLLPSLPFHPLLYNSSSRATSHRGTLNGNNNRNLQFLFDGNPRLNYIPYWVLQLLGTTVECFGCGLDPGESDNGGPNPIHPHEATTGAAQEQLHTHRSDVNRLKIQLNFKGKRRTLHFDEDLVKLHHSGSIVNVEGNTTTSVKVMVPSLLELCLRQVHQHDLLEEAKEKRNKGYGGGVKPVIEPLIVPQKAGNSLINIRGDLPKKDDEAMQEDQCVAIAGGKSVSNDQTLCKTVSVVLPSSSTATAATRAECASSSKVPTGQPNEQGNAEQFSAHKQHHHHHHHHHNSQEKMKQDDNLVIETRSTVRVDENHHQPNQTDEDNALCEEDAINLLLPLNLSKILAAGPVAKCFECLKPIFTESWPIIFHIPGWVFDENVRERMRGGDGGEENAIRGDWDVINNGKLSIGCAHFCSAPCVMRFRRGTKFSSNLVLNDLRCIVDNEISWINE